MIKFSRTSKIETEMENVSDTCQKADQQATSSGDENSEGAVPHVGQLID